MDEGQMSVIINDPEILGGITVFKGTRVPLKNLFDYLHANQTNNVFLNDFPSVASEQVNYVLKFAEKTIIKDALFNQTITQNKNL